MRIQVLKVRENLKGKGKALSQATDDLALPELKYPHPCAGVCTGGGGGGGACTCGIELGVALSKTISTPSLKIPLTKINVKLKKNVKMQIFQRGKCTKRNNKVKINNTRISTENGWD